MLTELIPHQQPRYDGILLVVHKCILTKTTLERLNYTFCQTVSLWVICRSVPILYPLRL